MDLMVRWAAIFAFLSCGCLMAWCVWLATDSTFRAETPRAKPHGEA